MTANDVQAFLSQQLAASASARRRFVPPSLVVPHVAVLRVQFVPDERAARVHMFVSRFAGMRQPLSRTGIGSRASQCFPVEHRVHGARYVAPHHRVFDAGAVLSVVNALRFASTRPTAGPSGIDDASARHMSGYYAMVVGMKPTRTRLTRESRGRIVASSRQTARHILCSPQRPTERASGRRPQGTASSASLTSPQSYPARM